MPFTMRAHCARVGWPRVKLDGGHLGRTADALLESSISHQQHAAPEVHIHLSELGAVICECLIIKLSDRACYTTAVGPLATA